MEPNVTAYTRHVSAKRSLCPSSLIPPRSLHPDGRPPGDWGACRAAVATMSACRGLCSRADVTEAEAARLNPNGSGGTGTKLRPSHIIIIILLLPMTASCHEQRHTGPDDCRTRGLGTTGHYCTRDSGEQQFTPGPGLSRLCLGLVFICGSVCPAWRQA